MYMDILLWIFYKMNGYWLFIISTFFSKKKEIYKERRKFFLFLSSSHLRLLNGDTVRLQSNSQNFFSLKNRHSRCVECLFWKFLQNFFKKYLIKVLHLSKKFPYLCPRKMRAMLCTPSSLTTSTQNIIPVRPRLFLPMKVSHGRVPQGPRHRDDKIR